MVCRAYLFLWDVSGGYFQWTAGGLGGDVEGADFAFAVVDADCVAAGGVDVGEKSVAEFHDVAHDGHSGIPRRAV